MTIDTLKSLFYRPDFFREQRFSGGASFRFYSLTLLVVVGVTVLMLLPGFFRVVDTIRSGEWQRQQAIIERLYPAGLELTLDRDSLTTNQDGPVVIPFPSEWRALTACREHCEGRALSLPTNLLVIDTDAPVTPQMMTDRETLILMGQHEVGLRNPERGETRIFNLREANISERVTVTKAVFDHWVGLGSDFLRTLFYIVATFIPLVMYIGLWIGYLIYSLFGALVVWLAGNIRGQSLTYARAYLSTLYLLLAPFVVTLLMQLTGEHIPLVFTLVLFIAALVNFPKATGPVIDSEVAQTRREPVEGAGKLSDPVKIATADAPVAPKDAEIAPASASDGEKSIEKKE